MTAQELAKALAEFPWEERCRIFEAAHNLAPRARLVRGVRLRLSYEGELTAVQLAKRLRNAEGSVDVDPQAALALARDLVGGTTLVQDIGLDHPVPSDSWKPQGYRSPMSRLGGGRPTDGL